MRVDDTLNDEIAQVIRQKIERMQEALRGLQKRTYKKAKTVKRRGIGHGKYMASMKGLTIAQKTIVKRTRLEEGIGAAVRKAKELRG